MQFLVETSSLQRPCNYLKYCLVNMAFNLHIDIIAFLFNCVINDFDKGCSTYKFYLLYSESKIILCYCVFFEEPVSKKNLSYKRFLFLRFFT